MVLPLLLLRLALLESWWLIARHSAVGTSSNYFTKTSLELYLRETPWQSTGLSSYTIIC